MRLLKVAWNWLLARRRTQPAYPSAPQIAVNFVADLPEEFSAGMLYVAGEKGQHWCAGMRCPCGCGAAIHLSLVKDDEPRWRLALDRDKRPSLSPSIWRTSGCHSHFFLRQGAIRWCASTVTTARMNTGRVQPQTQQE